MTEIGQAFAHHRFDDVIRALHPDATWDIVGATTHHGATTMITALQSLMSDLSGTVVTVRAVRAFASEHAAIVLSRADYLDPDSNFTSIGACDILEFTSELELITITSYTIDMTPSA